MFSEGCIFWPAYFIHAVTFWALDVLDFNQFLSELKRKWGIG